MAFFSAPDPDEQRLAAVELAAALQRAPEDDRCLLVAYHILGKTQQELAELLGLAQPTIHWRLMRARAEVAGAWPGGRHAAAVRPDQVLEIIELWQSGKYRSRNRLAQYLGLRRHTVFRVLRKAGLAAR